MSINLIGGNQGISMNGVHFFDILKFLTQSKAVKVFSNVKIDRNINPRGKNLKIMKVKFLLLIQEQEDI